MRSRRSRIPVRKNQQARFTYANTSKAGFFSARAMNKTCPLASISCRKSIAGFVEDAQIDGSLHRHGIDLQGSQHESAG